MKLLLISLSSFALWLYSFSDTAVTNLVNLANEKADASFKSSENDVDQQRNSLPDIPLTKKEKLELENSMHLQNSQSSESILHDREFEDGVFCVLRITEKPRYKNLQGTGFYIEGIYNEVFLYIFIYFFYS